MSALVDALAATAERRWYVLAFLAIYAVAALRHLGCRRTAALTLIGYGVALASEVPSIRWGIPYGLYHYLWQPAEPLGLDVREPAILGVPVFTDLSYVFLAYASYSAALFLLDLPPERRRSPVVALAAAVLFTALDVVIDPLALRGDRWFLGRIYHYPGGGTHFGVPISNYLGWLIVGLATLLIYQRIEARLGAMKEGGSPALGAALYFGVLAFNIALTFAIGEREIGVASAGVAFPLAALALARLVLRARPKPSSRARSGAAGS